MEAYYKNLEDEIKSSKRNYKQRGKKKDVLYIKNGECRRVTYSRRSKSLVLAAKELEAQTHCKVAVSIDPTWPNGCRRSYRSALPGTVSSNADQPVVEVTRILEPTVASSPIRKRPGPLPQARATLQPTPAKKASECRVCGVAEETSFWIGCGFTNPKTRRQDCPYWVHQNCINLYFKQRMQLEKLPFFCKKHAPK